MPIAKNHEGSKRYEKYHCQRIQCATVDLCFTLRRRLSRSSIKSRSLRIDASQ